MSLRVGARTIVDQCLNVGADEHVVLVNDGNDLDLIEALIDVLEQYAGSHEYIEYKEPSSHGAEPPETVATAMREADVFIAPTNKSLTHTRARISACQNGARGATLPTINKQIWNTALQADYTKVAERCQRIMELVNEADQATVQTPSGTDVSFDIAPSYYIQDTGLIHEPGTFGNLPAGETFGAPLTMSGTIVVDHFPFAPSNTRIEIEDNRVTAIEHPGESYSELAESFETIENSRHVAEFGVGTNPEATLIGNMLQDEKVYGTVHIAFGDNSSMVPDDDPHQNTSDLHVDTVCEDPTVYFDDTLVIDAGEPLVMD